MAGNLRTDFEKAVAQDATGILGEYIDFLRHSKKWWLLPIVVLLVLFSVLLVLSSSAAAPFIYSLF
jgi:hypothetical protein